MGRPARDLRGERFSHLVVVERAGSVSQSGNATWLCRCDCGATKIVVGAKLLRGDVKSCTCKKGALLAKANKGKRQREQNPNWKGGRSVASNGYVIVRVGTDHHLSDVRGYAYEHRVVAEATRQRRLLPKEEVHHINETKTDNTPSNLEPLLPKEHHAAHRSAGSRLRPLDAPNPVIACACGCGVTFTRYDSANRPRRFARGHR